MNAKNFFLLLTVFLACTLNTYGSDQITVSGSGIQLRRLFSMIEEQSDYLFFFVDSDIDGVEISVDVKDASVESVLDRALAQTNLVYEIEGRYITILAKKPGGGSVSQQGVQPPAVTVSGQCTDQNGLPLPGVVVMLKGKDTGTVVGDDGSYSIEVPDSQAVLVFSCLGYDEQEIPVRARTRIDVVMTENAMRLDDVVVVGYGTQVKGKLTGSVSDLKSDKLAKAPIANVTHALAGIRQCAGDSGRRGIKLYKPRPVADRVRFHTERRGGIHIRCPCGQWRHPRDHEKGQHVQTYHHREQFGHHADSDQNASACILRPMGRT